MAASDGQDLLDKLSELQEAETADWVSAILYEIGVNELLEAGNLRNDVGRTFGQLLDAEIQYHRHLESLLERDEFDAAFLARLNRGRDEALRRYLRQLSSARATSAATRRVRDVGLAQCHLALGHLDEAAAWLEAAVADGLDSPLLCLALGYTRYQQALARHAFRRRPTATGWMSFQRACLEAVRCFEAGLGGGIDGQLYWWMGTVLEAAGFEKDALEAYEKARAAEEQEVRDGAEEYFPWTETQDGELADALPDVTILDDGWLLNDSAEPLDLEWLDDDEDEPSE